MSIILHTGIPGSGKSYYAVYEMMFSGVQEKYFILHNIKGLKPEYFNEHVKDWLEIAPAKTSDFFTVQFFEKIVEEAKTKYGKSILLIVDEAWEYFEKLTDENLEFFSWHRHIGMDIWLITQDAGDLHRSVRKRAEYEITGNKSTIVDHFVYTFKANRTRFRVRKLPKKEEVFRAYKSFDVGGADKKKSRLLQFAAAAVVVATLGLIYGIGWAIPNMFGSKAADTGKNVRGPVKVADIKPPERIEPVLKKEKTSGIDWGKYHLASVYGNKCSLQDESGRLIGLRELLPKARVLEYENGCATIATGTGTIETVCRKFGLVKLKTEPGTAGGWGGGASSPPAVSGN